MSQVRCAALLIAAAMFASGIEATTGQDADARKAARGRAYSYEYIVPPPPAYMPSILPELKQKTARPEAPAKPKEDPAKKYIYTRAGYEEPRPVRPNKHVTYWNLKDGQVR